ncbi:MAG: hypothetical protein ACYDCK_03015 [Thermoplasmatota archaeon]
MTYPVEFGRVRFHVLPVVPGRSGEARRVESELIDAQPRVVAVETTAKHALDLRARLAGAKSAEMPFTLAVATADVAARFHGDATDPLLGVARQCQRLALDFVPLLAPSARPGFFARRRITRSVRGLMTESDEAAQAARVEQVLRADKATADAMLADEQAAAKRLSDLLYRDEVSRLLVVATAPRIPRVIETLRALAPEPQRARESPREEARAPAGVPREYPAYR